MWIRFGRCRLVRIYLIQTNTITWPGGQRLLQAPYINQPQPTGRARTLWMHTRCQALLSVADITHRHSTYINSTPLLHPSRHCTPLRIRCSTQAVAARIYATAYSPDTLGGHLRRVRALIMSSTPVVTFLGEQST